MDIQKELFAEFDAEADRTRKVLNAIPEDADFGWKPHEKSMSLGALASHVTDMSGEWAITTLNQDHFEWDASKIKKTPTSKAEVLERFEKEVVQAKAALTAIPLADWDKHWTFGANGQVFIDEPKYKVWRNWVVNHGAHHRGQLTVYLRLLGAKVPGTYGPSADEM